MSDGHNRNEEKPLQRPHTEKPAGITATPPWASDRPKTKEECWDAFWEVAAQNHVNACRRKAAAERAAQRAASGEANIEGDDAKPAR